MSGLLVAPECHCGSRTTNIRFDTDDHIGIVRCDECDEILMVASVLANKHLTVVKDPMAGELPEGAYHDLDAEGRLPPAAKEESGA